VTEPASLLRLTPEGSLALCAHDALTPSADDFVALFRARGERALLSLGAAQYSAMMPAPLPWLRALVQRFLAALCANPALEGLRGDASPALDEALLREACANAPLFDGAEYVSPTIVARLWSSIGQEFRSQIDEHEGSVESWLQRMDPRLHRVGRVCFHLAERRGDEDAPFAFLATFTTGVGAAGRVQHAPLGRAVSDAGAAGDRAALDALLEPVQRAAAASPFVRALLDAGELFHPLAWSPREAHAFLKEVALCESAGVAVRVPDWWSGGRAARASVRLSVGDSGPSKLTADSLLAWSLDVALDGEPLDDAEIAALRAAGAGLIRLRGRWVEADAAKLDAVLSRWRDALATAVDGVSLHRALRLVAGAGDETDPVSAADADWDSGWARVEAGPWLAERLRALRDPSASATTERDEDLRATLRPYQRDGVAWLRLLTTLGLGGVLADDMGLGKTVQIIAWMLRERASGGARSGRPPHLLVVPASLLSNWRDELARFAPSLVVKTAHPSIEDSPADAGALDAWRAGSDVVLTSYGALVRAASLRAASWSLVVIDEAQAIKNAGTQQARAVKALRSTARIALTGTPVENRLSDLWSLFDFAQPGLLGTQKGFDRYARALRASERSDAFAPLRSLVGPYILRRMKSDRSVVADLPDKCEVDVRCGLSRAQAAQYAEAVRDFERALGGAAGDTARRGAVLAALTRFKQVCNHPSQWLGDGVYRPEDSGKFSRLGAILEEACGRGEKVLVFTQFRELCEPLSSFARAVTGTDGLILHGETPVKSRGALVKRFQQDAGVQHFVLSLKAGGTGLNLTAAQHVVHFDRWWNPAVESQATDRAYRIGQKRNVLVHKFVCRGTVEERIDEMLKDKRALAERVLGAGDDGALRLTELDDDALVRLVRLDLSSAIDDE
jgi:superfamily II DNA or RNA helicase